MLRCMIVLMSLVVSFDQIISSQLTDVRELDDLLWSSLFEHDDALRSQLTRTSVQDTILRSASTLHRLHIRDAPHLCDLTSALSRLSNHGIELRAAERACISAIRCALSGLIFYNQGGEFALHNKQKTAPAEYSCAGHETESEREDCRGARG